MAIATENLTRRFGRATAVDGLDLQVPMGCICGFLGPNGAGKTTTLRLILGLLRADRGTILLNGKLADPADPASRGGIGALIESPSLYPHLTGRENLEVARRLLGATSGQVDSALAAVRLEEQADKLVRHYSLGMRQRLALALALLGDPQLLILDEPANGLDPAGVIELRDLLRQLVASRRVTVVLSSHMLLETEQVADYVAVIARGRLQFQGTLEAFRGHSRRRLQVALNDVEAGLACLRAQGWASAAADGGVEVEIRGDGDAAAINTLLVGAGFAVSRLCEERAGLEALFLASVEEASA